MKAGEIFIATTGSYSDYVIIDLFRCIKDFSENEMAVRFEHDHRINRSQTEVGISVDEDKMIDCLESTGFIEKVKHKEFHLGDYQDYEILKEEYDAICDKLLKERKGFSWRIKTINGM